MFSKAIVKSLSSNEDKDKEIRKVDFDKVSEYCNNFVFENLIFDLKNEFIDSRKNYKKTQINFELIDDELNVINLDPILEELHYGHPTKYNKESSKSEKINFTVTYILSLGKFRKAINETFTDIELKIYKSKNSDKIYDIIFKKIYN